MGGGRDAPTVERCMVPARSCHELLNRTARGGEDIVRARLKDILEARRRRRRGHRPRQANDTTQEVAGQRPHSPPLPPNPPPEDRLPLTLFMECSALSSLIICRLFSSSCTSIILTATRRMDGICIALCTLPPPPRPISSSKIVVSLMGRGVIVVSGDGTSTE